MQIQISGFQFLITDDIATEMQNMCSVGIEKKLNNKMHMLRQACSMTHLICWKVPQSPAWSMANQS